MKTNILEDSSEGKFILAILKYFKRRQLMATYPIAFFFFISSYFNL